MNEAFILKSLLISRGFKTDRQGGGRERMGKGKKEKLECDTITIREKMNITTSTPMLKVTIHDQEAPIVPWSLQNLSHVILEPTDNLISLVFSHFIDLFLFFPL